MDEPDDRSGGTPSLVDRFRRWRTRLVADPGFQRASARFFLTRPLANRSASDLFRLTAGFTFSQVLRACVDLQVLDHLAGRDADTGELARLTALPLAAAEKLMTAAAGLDLVRPSRSGKWALADLGAVVQANPGIVAMIRHHEMLYRDLQDPVALLRGTETATETAAFWAYANAAEPGAIPDSRTAEYSELMRLSQDLIATEVLDSYPFARHRTVLDVGGGDGAFLCALGARHASVALQLFDLPSVAERAKTVLEERGFGGRATVHGGSFLTDPLPADADCITLNRIICDHDDDAALVILRNVRAAMKPGAMLLITEAMAGKSRHEGFAAAYFSFYFLAMGSGRCRRPQEITALLRAAGFRTVARRRTRMPIFASLITAQA